MKWVGVVSLISILLVACSDVAVEPEVTAEPPLTEEPTAEFAEATDPPAVKPLPTPTETGQPMPTIPPDVTDITLDTPIGVIEGAVIRICLASNCPGELDPPPLEIERFVPLDRDHRVRLDFGDAEPELVLLRMWEFRAGRLNLRETTGFDAPGSNVDWVPDDFQVGRFVMEVELIWGTSNVTYWFMIVLPGQGTPEGEPPVPPRAWLVLSDGTRVELVREVFCSKARSGRDVCDIPPIVPAAGFVRLNEGDPIRIEFEPPGPAQSIIDIIGTLSQDLPGAVGFPGGGGVSAAAGPNLFEHQTTTGDFLVTVSSVWEDGAHAYYSMLVAIPGDPPPTSPPLYLRLFLQVDQQWIEGITNSFCPPNANCVDSPPSITDFFPLPTDSIIRLGADDPPPVLQVRLHPTPFDPADTEHLIAEGEISFSGETYEWSPQVPPGDYVLEVIRKYGNHGSARYWFGITMP